MVFMTPPNYYDSMIIIYSVIRLYCQPSWLLGSSGLKFFLTLFVLVVNGSHKTHIIIIISVSMYELATYVLIKKPLLEILY